MISTSLLVPAHNAASYLHRIATSAAAQTLPFTEWLCFNDASTDHTAEVAVEVGFHVTGEETNRGPSYARNRLADAARGEWLHFHDADDLLAPEYLARAVGAISSDRDVIICDASWELETSREQIIHWTYRQGEYDADPLAYILTHPVGVISALIRKEVFMAVGGFDEKINCWEDADLFVRLAERGARFRMIEGTLVTSLRHDRGLSHNQLHCDHCRLQFLRGYAKRQPPRLHPVHACEVEKLIPRFLFHGDVAAAYDALAFCRELGGSPPTTAHPLLRRLKRFLPAMWLIRLQNHRRARIR